MREGPFRAPSEPGWFKKQPALELSTPGSEADKNRPYELRQLQSFQCVVKDSEEVWRWRMWKSAKVYSYPVWAFHNKGKFLPDQDVPVREKLVT